VDDLCLRKGVLDRFHRRIGNDAFRCAKQTRESGNPDDTFLQAEFVNPLDRVLPPTVATIADIDNPLLCLFPPSRAVENVSCALAFTGKHGKTRGCKTADRREIARVALELFPPTRVRRQQQAIDAALCYFGSNDPVATITFLE